MLIYRFNAPEPEPQRENLCPTCGQTLPNIKPFIDPISGDFIAPECRIKLEPAEAEFLRAILRRRAIKLDDLYTTLYGARPDGGPDPKIIPVMVCKVRKKLRKTPYTVETLWGQGLRFRDSRNPVRRYT